jgi:hypothetical protein
MFGIFQKAIKLDKTEDELHPNYPALADHSEEELKGCCNPYISKSFVDRMMQYVAYLARCNPPDDDDDECPEL